MNTIAIRAGQLIDGTGAEPVADAVVVIEGDTIQAVGAVGEVQIPPGAEAIDAGAMTLMPGLMDIHHHISGAFEAVRTLRLTLQRGMTTIGSVSGGPAGCRLRDAIDAGAIRGCSRFLSAGVVVPTNGHVPGRNADGPWEVRKAVREMVQAGCDYIKTAASGGFWGERETCSVRNYTLEELVALVDEAHAWGVPVAAHCHTQPGLNNCIQAGVDQIHHGAFIDDEAVEGIAREGLYYIPSLRVTCRKNIDAWTDRPWMKAEMEQSSPIHRAGVRKAHELGVTVGIGTDGPGTKAAWKPGDATPWEMQELVEVGFTPMEAIVAATHNTAQAMRILDRVGTLQVGKKADLLVVNADPLADISVLYDGRNIVAVFKGGRMEACEESFKHYYTVKDEE